MPLPHYAIPRTAAQRGADAPTILLHLVIYGALYMTAGTVHPLAAQGTAPVAPHRDTAAVRIVRRAIHAIGGAARLRAVHTLELRGSGRTMHVGDSEWLNGPYIPNYLTIHGWRDVAGARSSTTITMAAQVDAPARTFRVVNGLERAAQLSITDGRVSGGQSTEPDTLAFLLAPERVLFTALHAADLTRGRDTLMRMVRHEVVRFHIGRVPVRLFFESETGVPRMVETVRAFPHSIFYNAWGDVTECIRFGLWYHEKSGILFPHQIDVERNGRPVASTSYATVTVNAVPPAGIFRVADSIWSHPPLRADVLPLGLPGQHPTVVAPGVVHIAGYWNTALVRQSDGVVVIEAPISAEYSARVLAEAARRFPGLPVKAVVSTTDFWWHVAGLREYIARGIPIYVLDHNEHVVRERARAPHTLAPDSLQRSPRAPVIRVVRDHTVIGSGENRIELIPYRTEGLDRMMMAYLPGRHLLYTAEGVQIYGGKLFFAQTAIEVEDAVRREGLTPTTFMGMHVSPMPWASLTRMLDSLRADTLAPAPER